MRTLSKKALAKLERHHILMRGRPCEVRVPIPSTVCFKDRKKEANRNVCRGRIDI